jgi:magnesium chelatase family protein
MRQPLEDGKVTIARVAATVTYPSRFMLVSAMNPCPCGFFGDPKRACKCPPGAVARYRQRLSGPLLDRIDLHVEVPLVEFKDLSRAEPGEASALIRDRVIAARQLQLKRFSGSATLCNAAMSSKQLREYASIDEDSRQLMEDIMTEQNFSARAHDRILKVARTIADLEGAPAIEQQHLMEAVGYRTLDKNLWG